MHELAGDIQPLEEETTQKKQKTTSTNQNQHWPIHVEEQGRCWYCYQIKKVVSKPRIKCEFCDKYLCIDPCFKLYHTTCVVE
jgi:thioredoxin-related protein